MMPMHLVGNFPRRRAGPDAPTPGSGAREN